MYKLSKQGIKQSLYFKSIGDLALALNISQAKTMQIIEANEYYNGWKIEIIKNMDNKEAKTMFPWEYVEDKTNLWKEYTEKECGLE